MVEAITISQARSVINTRAERLRERYFGYTEFMMYRYPIQQIFGFSPEEGAAFAAYFTSALINDRRRVMNPKIKEAKETVRKVRGSGFLKGLIRSVSNDMRAGDLARRQASRYFEDVAPNFIPDMNLEARENLRDGAYRVFADIQRIERRQRKGRRQTVIGHLEQIANVRRITGRF